MSNSNTVFMARQPIYDRDLGLVGYELLYRRANSKEAGTLSATESGQSIVNALIDIGLPLLSGNHKAYINVDEDLILSGILDLLPRKQVVLEILETVNATNDIIKEVKRLCGMGYTLALDDFVFDAEKAALIPYTRVIKLDVSMYTDSELRKEVVRLRQSDIKLLAEKVETTDMFRFCRQLGFDFFQGYFFAKPQTVHGQSLPPNKLALLNLIAKIQKPDVDFSELEEIIGADLSLNYRLLKFIKSAHFGVPSRVTSVRQSLLFVGVKTVASLATLLAMSQLTDKPGQLMLTGMVRAKMCETLAVYTRSNLRDRYFTAGLLSVLDGLLNQPMEALLAELPLSDEINSALLDPECENEIGRALQCVLAYEKGHWENSGFHGLTMSQLDEAYRLAISWSCDTNNALAA